MKLWDAGGKGQGVKGGSIYCPHLPLDKVSGGRVGEDRDYTTGRRSRGGRP